MTGHFIVDFGPENEEGTIGAHVGLDLDSSAENTVRLEFNHLFDVHILTSDDEFEEALLTTGVRKTRGRVEYMAYSSGEEVEQMKDVRPASGLGPQPSSTQRAPTVSAQQHVEAQDNPDPVDHGVLGNEDLPIGSAVP
ncbi:hypothetical protein LINPERHAP1_LOCUS3624 [Linum perenne]